MGNAGERMQRDARVMCTRAAWDVARLHHKVWEIRCAAHVHNVAQPLNIARFGDLSRDLQ